MDWEKLYAPRMARVAASDIRERMKLLNVREIIHLGGGLPDPDLFPYDALEAASARIMGDRAQARTALQYAPSEGHGPLRAWIAEDLTRRGAPCAVENILITNGSQQALDFAAKMLLAPGDAAMVEIPSFIGALRAFDLYEPRYIGLPDDISAWRRAASSGAKFCYVGPDFRNPTGTSLSLRERETLVDAALAGGMAILEDGCYERLRYEGETLPSLLAVGCAKTGDVNTQPVLSAGTFSKTIAPSLRVGWIAGPQAVIRKLTLIKQSADLATSAFNQMVMLDVAQNALESAVASACAAYRDRRDSMLRALSAHMPEGARWTMPEGGLYIWVTLPEHIDGGAFALRALQEHNVSVISGAAFYPSGAPALRNTIRLSFSFIGAEPAHEGVARLGALARAWA